MNTWSIRKTVGAVAVAAAVAGVGGAAIAAATENSFHGGSGGFGDFAGFGGAEVPPGSSPGARHGSAEPASLHGEYVVADDRGGFSTLITQTGTITAISRTSVTARSADGFSQTYVTDASAPTLAIGDTVVIKATRKGEAVMVSTMGPPLSPGH